MYRPKMEKYDLIRRRIGLDFIDCVEVDVIGNDYIECERASSGKEFWGNSKPGDYGAGLGRVEGDPYKPARTGLLGQMAFGKLFGVGVDTVHRIGGDSYDNKIRGLKIDIKCAMSDYGEILVYHMNEWGTEIPIDKDIYVGSFIDIEKREDHYAKIVIVGYILGEDVRKCDIKRGYRGSGHYNYVVPFSDLRDIMELRDILVLRN